MSQLFLSAFITLFVVIDPPGCAPIYAGLTKGADGAQRRNMAIRATLIAAVILLVFALFGEELLGALHIELDSFRIAGGLMLFWIAFEMVFEKRTQRREERAERVAATPEVEDVSVFPMAIPMLAGPGAIAAIMLLMNEAEGPERQVHGPRRAVERLADHYACAHRGRADHAPVRRQGGGGHHPRARRVAGGTGGAVCD